MIRASSLTDLPPLSLSLSRPLKSPRLPLLIFLCDPSRNCNSRREKQTERMGLPSDLTNISSDSIPILLVALAAHGVCYIKSLLCCLLHSMGLSGFCPSSAAAPADDPADVLVMGSLVVVGDHANVGRVYTLREEGEGQQEEEENECWVEGKNDDDDDGGGGLDLGLGSSAAAECVVCLSGMRDGEQVRKLACCHVFHRACLEGWFDHEKTTCPLCRAPLASVR